MFSLSVPSKTFLIGEYGALKGGPALLLATPPRFVLKSSLCLGANCKRTGLEGGGPASRLLKDPAYNDYEFHFHDPHGGRGGLGASSAQFLLLHAFYNWLKFQPTRADRLLGAYRDAVQSQTEIMPSGYDVLAQFRGGLSFIHWKKSQFESVEWSLSDLDVILVRGPLKVATHVHLRDLKLGDTAEFESLAWKAFDSIRYKKPEQFVESINEFSRVLQKNKLTVPESLEFQRRIQAIPGVLAVKGCGALGADVILAVVKVKDREKIVSQLRNEKFEIVSKLSDKSAGLKVDEMSHDELQSKFESELTSFREEQAGNVPHDVVS